MGLREVTKSPKEEDTNLLKEKAL